jgi:hypothetical protein
MEEEEKTLKAPVNRTEIEVRVSEVSGSFMDNFS